MDSDNRKERPSSLPAVPLGADKPEQPGREARRQGHHSHPNMKSIVLLRKERHAKLEENEVSRASGKPLFRNNYLTDMDALFFSFYFLASKPLRKVIYCCLTGLNP